MFGSRRVLDDEHVLETVKAEGEGLNLAAKRIGTGRSFDEKNEFCARTGFGLHSRAIIFFNSSQVEPLGLESVFRVCFQGAARAFGGVRVSKFGGFCGCSLAIWPPCKAAATRASLSLATRFELEPSLWIRSELPVHHTVLKFSLNFDLPPMVSFSSL